MTRPASPLFLAALTALAAATPAAAGAHQDVVVSEALAAPFVDHHVHLLGPGLIRDWKALGVSFSRPDSAYLSAERLLGPPGSAAGQGAPLDRVVLVPMGHLYGNVEFRAGTGLDVDEEHRRVADENDHVAREAARYPGRAVALCSAAALRPYARAELERCVRDNGSAGIKLHLASSGVDLRTTADLDVLAALTAWAQKERLPVLLHLDTQRRGTTVEDVTRFATRVLAPYPELTVVVAHLGGSGGYGAWTRSVFTTLRDWVAEREAAGIAVPAIFFDLSAVLLEGESEGVPATTPEQAATLAADLRARGFDRLLFGSDSPVFDPTRVVDLLGSFAGLAPTEIAKIRANSVPGLFPEGSPAAP